MTNVRFLEGASLPQGFKLPPGYVHTITLGLTNLDPWHFTEATEYAQLSSGIAKRYPSRLLVPFARRTDSDDVACFVIGKGTDEAAVVVIHDFANPGWEGGTDQVKYWDWFKIAVDEMIELSL